MDREAAGRRAEAIATVLLALKGYRILDQRFRAPGGEIDIIAARPLFGKPQQLFFVEVKRRQNRQAALESIQPRQRRRIESAAGAFLARHPDLAGAAWRFDAVLVSPWRWPLHLVDAWRGEG